MSSKKPGTYASLIEDKKDDAFLRMYIGQASNLRARIEEHGRKMKSGSSLHYRVAMRESAVTSFVVLGEFSADQEDLSMHLNIQEMWFSCLFQTLPRETLRKFLAEEELLAAEIGLNVASPLSQTHGQKAVRDMGLLKHSTDPLVQEYYQEVIVPQNQANWAKGREVNVKDGFKSIIDAKRANSEWSHLVRDPETAEEMVVVVKCVECRSDESQKTDRAPTYEKSSGKYIVRGQRCPVCPAQKGKKGMRQTFFEPVDAKIPTIRARQVYRRFK